MPEAEMMDQLKERIPKDKQGPIAEAAAQLTPDDMVAISVARDATMAERLAEGVGAMVAGEKVLAICGDFHARTTDHSPADSPVKPLWPSMAAALASKHPEWRLKSLHAHPFSGEYFNGGKVNRFTERPIEGVEFRSTADADWDAELNLPRATVATFLKTPGN
jgi:hypothetical protein